MPNIHARMATVDNMASYTVADGSHSPAHQINTAVDPTSLRTSSSSNLMSITNGNSVPMRGVLPIEQMSDHDLNRFFPYTAFFDRIPSYTYYALANRK